MRIRHVLTGAAPAVVVMLALLAAEAQAASAAPGDAAMPTGAGLAAVEVTCGNA